MDQTREYYVCFFKKVQASTKEMATTTAQELIRNQQADKITVSILAYSVEDRAARSQRKSGKAVRA